MATLYLALKSLHIGAVSLSFGLFVLRAAWVAYQPARLQQRWVRVLPHVVDSVLLASALGLVWLLGQYPGRQDWLTAKVVALVVYIGLGTIGLKRGRTRTIRVTACVAAVLVFAYIVTVALSHDPLGPLALWD